MDYIVLAKGNKKQFFIQQLLGDFLNISLTISLYYFYGLLGIGIASVLMFLLSGLYLLRYVIKNYEFSFSEQVSKSITVSFTFF